MSTGNPSQESARPGGRAGGSGRSDVTMILSGRSVGPRLLAIVCMALAAPTLAATGGLLPITGIVRGPGGPLSGARVRIQTTAIGTTTDTHGAFTLLLPASRSVAALTAWAPGYFIGLSGPVEAGARGVVIDLEPHGDQDHPEYGWVSALAEGTGGGHCKNCHSASFPGPERLPFDEWRADAHSRSAANPRFLTMYTGRDVHGHESPRTRRGRTRDYGSFPLPPDEGPSYFGPGYALDFPDTAGNCGACHLPAAAVNAPYEADPASADGVAGEGVTCDVCHKVVDVIINPETGLPFANRPGVMSFKFLRPAAGHQLFAGPLDDVAPGHDVYSQLYRESRYCAPCHVASFWGTVIYNSFGEWLASPYADPATGHGRTCQGCHMPSRGASHFVRLDHGGLPRDPASIASHLMPGADDIELLRGASRVHLAADRGHGMIDVEINVENVGAGHHLPTGSPLRQMFLVVKVTDSAGEQAGLCEGSVLPAWSGDLAGSAGRAFARIFQDRWTGETPSVSYWKPLKVLSDTRIPALASDQSQYRFAVTRPGPAIVHARLLFRHAPAKLAMLKGWDDPDILMWTETLRVP